MEVDITDFRVYGFWEVEFELMYISLYERVRLLKDKQSGSTVPRHWDLVV
jgi:hypothetical protein